MTTDVLNGGAPALPSESANPADAQVNASTANAQTGGADGGTESQVTRTYTEQEHRDAIERATAKAAAKAERRAFREAAQRLAQQSAPQQHSQQASSDDRPSPRQGETTEAYLDRLTDWKLEQRDRRAEAGRQQEQQRTLAQKTDTIYAEAEKLPGFDRDAFDELPLTRSIVEALVDSDVSARLMAFMASNPAEVERISKLPAARQAAEVGKLEARLPATPKTSKTPAPIGDPTARGSTTTVPSDPGKMTHEQYRAWRKAQGARWAQ